MTKAAQAGVYSVVDWADGTRRSYTQPAIFAGGPPVLSLSAVGQAVTIAINAIPTSGRSIVRYEVERSADGVTYTPVSLPDPVAPSEIPARSTATANKVVNPSLTANGTTIFNTWAACFATLNPGDVVDIAPGTYSEAPVLTRSGLVGSRIIIRAQDPANPPTLDGSYTLPVGWSESGNAAGSTAMLSIAASYVTLDGINIRNSRLNGLITGPADNNGSFLSNPATWFYGIELVRVSVRGCGAAGWKTHNVEDVKFYGCEFLDLERNAYRADGYLNLNPNGWGSGLMLMGKKILGVESTVGQVSGEGIHLGYHGAWGGGDGYAHIQAEDVVLRRIIAFDCWSAPIYVTNVDGTSEDASVIEQCTIFHTNDPRYWYGASLGYPQYGIDVASESGNTGVRGTNFFTGARNLVIRNNVLTGSLRPFRFQNWPSQQTTGVKVLHNTIFATQPGAAASVASTIANYETELTGVTWVNNLVYEAVDAQMCREWQPIGGTFTRGTNLYSTTPPAALSGSGDIITAAPGLTDAAYRVTNAYPAVPVFDTAKIKLIAGSPAANAAQIHPSATKDYFGNPRPAGSGKYDIGAHSISKPNSTSYVESSVPVGTQRYRGRYTDSSGAVTPWSDLKLVAVA